jgi:hypothetical protein
MIENWIADGRRDELFFLRESRQTHAARQLRII